ncbi:MAG: sporulation protein YabP [Ruminococcus sp.]|nr:sporulation protein YabP [Ruminococcus sp.]
MSERHNAILENRSKLMLTGVTDVENFDENKVYLYTQLGELVIRGKQLHVNEISLESGELTVEGEINALIYGDKDRTKKLGLLGKLFR